MIHPAAMLAGLALLAEPVNLKAGDPAPFDGAICDAACAEGIRVKRAQCDEENRRLKEALLEKPPEAVPSEYAYVGFIGFVVGFVTAGSIAAYLALK